MANFQFEKPPGEFDGRIRYPFMQIYVLLAITISCKSNQLSSNRTIKNLIIFFFQIDIRYTVDFLSVFEIYLSIKRLRNTTQDTVDCVKRFPHGEHISEALITIET